jgi:glycosyltransferase involved in cell wall biosynthesis
MVIGVVWDISLGRCYRAIDPMNLMARRGHRIVWPTTPRGDADPDRLRHCDVVLVYRRSDPTTQVCLRYLVQAGVPIVFDNDDHLMLIPKGAYGYEQLGALRGQRTFAFSVQAAKQATLMTATCEPLAEVYRRAGVQDVRVIPNQLRPRIPRPRIKHEGLVVGWVAGGEHTVDAEALGIADVLQAILDKHPSVIVDMVGFDLKLQSDRYRHDEHVDFEDLPRRIGTWDIGLAPLADIPFNHMRSDIKIKEYAAAGLAWLASPVSPYRHLGEREGGILVEDGGWHDAIERLILHDRLRKKLGRRAAKWAKGQTIEAVADRWERALADAASARVAA